LQPKPTDELQMPSSTSRRGAGLSEFLKDLGPGLITGAADDDPSGISTYSVAGASYGYATLWTALLSFPLMAAIQLMCARLGMVTGCGLASVIRTRYSRWVLWFACALVIAANVFNIGADLGGIGDATQMITGVRAFFWTPFFAVLILGILLWTSYRTMARVFKWLTMVLLAYVAAAFLSHPNWSAVLRATFIPQVEWSRDYISVLVGILGTTISPYLFFWQAAQEVEEDRDHGKNTVVKRKGATNKELRVAKRDVITGMLLSNLVMSFSFSQPGRHSTLMDNNTSKLQSKLLRLSVLLQAQEPIGCSRLESSGPECWQFQYWPDLAHTRSRKEPNGKTPHLTSSRNLRPTFMP
jgi:Mn2+/Fe2+ NRAMP family transporter